ncbi:YlbD family protein [Neobacillus sp. FSL H8-0543]|uniref:YlbD family protein n=1 Tax=Neobacillus sp. FSL H8-0543 TaxID=2954672 RepID=UPI00315954FE
MMPKKLHPSVVNFKEFVSNNPKLILEVRKGEATWQELYEDWYLLGEEDSRWEIIRSENKIQSEENTDKKGDWISTIMGTIQKMDPEQVQHYINNLSQALGAIQGVLSQFQGSNKTNQVKPQIEQRHPFLFRKD